MTEGTVDTRAAFQGRATQKERSLPPELAHPIDQAARLVETAKSGFVQLITKENFPAVQESDLAEYRYSAGIYRAMGIRTLAEGMKDDALRARMEMEAEKFQSEAEAELRAYFEEQDGISLAKKGTALDTVSKTGQYL